MGNNNKKANVIASGMPMDLFQLLNDNDDFDRLSVMIAQKKEKHEQVEQKGTGKITRKVARTIYIICN